MAARANIRAVITADDRTGRALRGFEGRVSRVGRRVGRAARAAAVAFGVATAAATTFAVKSAADFEQSRVAFETMLGSAEKARDLLREVSDFAARTPFELPEVVNASKQLLAMGGSADTVLEELKALGDVAAGTGTPLERLILNFGQVRLQGKLTGRELRDFAVGGVPLIEELAKSLGVAEERISEMVSEGEIGFPEVKEAFENMTGEGGKFFDLMDKQSKTFSGTMSNVRDQIGRVARRIVGINDQGDIREGSMFFHLRNAAQRLADWLTENEDQIVGFFQSVQNTIRDMWNGMKDAWNWMMNTALPFLKDQFGEQIKSLADTIDNTRDSISKFWRENKDELVPILEDLAKLIGGALLESIKLAIDQIDRWNRFLGFLADFATEATDKMKAIRDAFIDIKNWLLKNDGTLAQSIRSSFGPLGAAIDSMKWIDRWLDKDKNKTIKVTVERSVKGAVGSSVPGLNFLPGFAHGTDFAPGGMAIVGERGPELVNLPRGSQVVPNKELRTTKNNNTTININVSAGAMMGNKADARRFGEEIMGVLRQMANRDNTTVSQLLEGGF